ncbi:MAG: DUF1127 domain-containing protein [Pseudomonadota bacterium]
MIENILDSLLGRTEADRRIEALEALDDHQLADLGISRDQIPAYVQDLSEAA